MWNPIKAFNKSPTTRGGGIFQLNQKKEPPTLGTKGALDIFSESPWIHAVVDKTARTVGETSWRLYAVKDSKGKIMKNHRSRHLSKGIRKDELETKARQGNLEEIESHPLLDFLHIANDFLHGTMSMKVTQMYLDLVGEAFWIIERNSLGQPIRWYPIPPTWVRDLPSKDRHSYVIHLDNGYPYEIPSSEVIPFIQPNPINPYGRGVSSTQALSDEAEIDDYSSQHVKSFFYNNARPDLIISGEGMSQDEAHRLDKKWRQEHQGFFRSFKPMFMNRKIDVQQIGHNFEHLQMVPLKQNQRDTIIATFGVSPEMVGVIESSNRSSIDAASYFFSKFAVEPRQEHLRDIIQNKIVPMFDESLVLDYDSVVPEDKEQKLSLMEAAPWAYTIDEWRKEAGYDPLPDDEGNARLLPLNEVQVPIGESAPDPENGDRNTDTPTVQEQYSEDQIKETENKVRRLYGDFGEEGNRKIALKLLGKLNN